MSAYTVEVVDSLSLLSLKVASNVFDLSSGMHHVSIRDQIVRARLAIRDLRKGDASADSILIVGAGVAGISAALEAVEQGLKHIVVVDAGAAPFSLFQGVTKRHVGPFMYEWPSSFFGEQSYPDHAATPWKSPLTSHLKWSAKDPISADALAKTLACELDLILATLINQGKHVPAIFVNVDRHRISSFVKEFARHESGRAVSRLQNRKPAPGLRFHLHQADTWPGNGQATRDISPQYIFLAAGMGVETVRLVKTDDKDKPYTGPNYDGPFFWSDKDTLLDAGTAHQEIAVFGGGDGALQDVLRALTGHAHPLQFLKFLEKSPRVKNAFSRITADLLAMERQSRLSGNWTARNMGYGGIDGKCNSIARELARDLRIVRRVGQGLRRGSGRVSLFVRDGCFDKTYLLNRFLVHLLACCAKVQKTMWAKRMRFELHFKHAAVGYSLNTDGTHLVQIKRQGQTKPYPPRTFDVIAVRYGIAPGTVPGAQMIQVSPKPSKQRTTLAKVELPFVVET